jgi:hypothetical protein
MAVTLASGTCTNTQTNNFLQLTQEKVAQNSLLLAPKSVLLLDGPDISIRNLRVDGALVVRAVPGAKVVLDGLTVSNQGWNWTPIDKVNEWICM